jgi:hypothetical protein
MPANPSLGPGKTHVYSGRTIDQKPSGRFLEKKGYLSKKTILQMEGSSFDRKVARGPFQTVHTLSDIGKSTMN